MTDGPIPIPSRTMIGRWNVDQYIDNLRWPIGFSAALILLASLIQRSIGTIVLLEVIGIGWMAWTVQKHNGRRVESLVAGAAVGLAMGLGYSLGQFVIHPSALTIISSVWQTLVTAVAASLLTTALILVYSLRSSSSHPTT